MKKLLFFILLLPALGWAQPNYQAFKNGYQPHNERPGKDETVVIVVNALDGKSAANTLQEYWDEGKKDIVWALMVSVEREKAGEFLNAMPQSFALNLLNYMEKKWAQDLLWYVSEKTYQKLKSGLQCLRGFSGSNSGEGLSLSDILAGRSSGSNTGSSTGSSQTASQSTKASGSATGAERFPTPDIRKTTPSQIPENLIFSDEFNNNEHQWEEYTNSSATAKVENGQYRIKYLTDGGMFYDKSRYIDPQKDYYFETTIERYDGATGQSGFGFYWGRADLDNYNAFMFNMLGICKIYSEDEKNGLQNWMEWANVSSIMNADVNKVAIHKKGNRIFYYLNGHLIFEGTPPKFYGQHFGYIILNEASIGVENLKVAAPPTPINLVDEKQNSFKKENLGRGINSADIEVSPVISHDGQTMYFSKRKDNHTKGNIWVSELQADGSWGDAQKMPAPLNNSGSNGVIAVSPDGNTLLLNNKYNALGYSAGAGLSMANRSTSGWEIPENLEIEDYYNDHTAFTSAAMSPNQKVLIMALKRKEGLGNLDLYASFKQDDGTWSAPRSLGTTINSSGQETGGFIAADNKTMYFSTDGLPGYGSADVYVTKRLDDTWTKWSNPKNLGPAINTPEWDGHYTVPADGKHAYFSSYDNSFGASDIYSIQLVEEAKPDPVVIVQGTVYDAETKEPIGAEIFYEDLGTETEMGLARSHPKSGEYKIALPYGQNYGFRAVAEKYYSVNEHLDISESESKRIVIEQDLYLSPLELNKPIRINNLFFERAKAVLLTTSYPELNRLVKLLQDNPSVKIRIEGHTDNGKGATWAAAKLKQLSGERAAAVKEYLVKHSIDAERISTVGHGGSKPAFPNNSPENMAKNRRVEFVIVSR